MAMSSASACSWLLLLSCFVSGFAAEAGLAGDRAGRQLKQARPQILPATSSNGAAAKPKRTRHSKRTRQARGGGSAGGGAAGAIGGLPAQGGSAGALPVKGATAKTPATTAAKAAPKAPAKAASKAPAKPAPKTPAKAAPKSAAPKTSKTASRTPKVKASARPPPPARTDSTTNTAKRYLSLASDQVFTTYSNLNGGGKPAGYAMKVVTGIIKLCGGQLRDHVNGVIEYNPKDETDLQAAQSCVKNDICGTTLLQQKEVCQVSGII